MLRIDILNSTEELYQNQQIMKDVLLYFYRLLRLCLSLIEALRLPNFFFLLSWNCCVPSACFCNRLAIELLRLSHSTKTQTQVP